jgi:hypothetical protein
MMIIHFLNGLVSHLTRHRQLGNAFQADVMMHVLSCWLKFVPVHRDFDSTLGKPGEGPNKRKEFVWDMQGSLLKEAIREAVVVQVRSRVEPVQSSHLTMISAPLEPRPKKPKGKCDAKWRAVVPDGAQEVRGQVSVFERVGGLAGGGNSDRQVLTRRQSRLDTINFLRRESLHSL